VNLEQATARGDHWKKVAVEIEQDRDRLLGELEAAYELRLEWGSIRAAVDPEVHTPARMLALLAGFGWVKERARRGGEVWHSQPEEDGDMTFVFVPLETSFADWDKRAAELARDLADRLGTGELGVLARIAGQHDA